MKILSLLLFILLTCLSCSQQKKGNSHFDNFKNISFTVHKEFENYFENCGVKGSIAIFDNKNQQWILSDTINIKTESLPASTFKIINLLIALETKTIKNENEIVKWVGKTDTVKYGYRPEIYHDMSVKKAFEVSAGWVFIELAKKIGKEKYKKYLSACNYGNLNLTEKHHDFWNFGKFGITPINQVEFIKNLYEGKLPFSKRNIEIVKSVMITEQTGCYTISAKTGWTRENNTNTGWWVGYIEANDNTYFFATRLLQNRKNNRDDFGSCRKEITKKIFYDLQFLRCHESSIKKYSLFNSIDHIPIVVKDLEKIKDVFQNQLHFSIKEGKVHEGIKNCFVKFSDTTYLEFIEPLDSSNTIGKYYTDFLKTRQGCTSMAISVKNAEFIKKMLSEKNIQFNMDSNTVWQIIEPKNMKLFFIEYLNKGWKENSKNTTHSNTTTSLNSTYILCDNIDKEAKEYIDLGFTENEKGEYLGAPYLLFKVGQSNLYLLDSKKSIKINQLLNTKSFQGICGFQIKVESLKTFNKLIKQNKNIKHEKNKTTVFLEDHIFFMIFTE